MKNKKFFQKQQVRLRRRQAVFKRFDCISQHTTNKNLLVAVGKLLVGDVVRM